MNLRYAFLICFSLLVFFQSCSDEPFVEEPLAEKPREGVFKFATNNNFQNKVLDVFYFIPVGDVSTMKTIVIMHGTDRNAGQYISAWIPKAKEKKFILIAPAFTESEFNSSQYNEGNATDTKNNLNSPDQMTFSLIDKLFEEFNSAFKLPSKKYNLYGHSAGAQFAHKFVLFYASPYVDMVFAANAGWYTFPDITTDYPYGLKGISNLPQDLQRKAFLKDLMVLVGEKDLIRDSNLRINALADAQGLNRFERGQKFFQDSKATASDLKYDFIWKFQTVPNVGHEHILMSAFVADLIK